MGNDNHPPPINVPNSGLPRPEERGEQQGQQLQDLNLKVHPVKLKRNASSKFAGQQAIPGARQSDGGWGVLPNRYNSLGWVDAVPFTPGCGVTNLTRTPSSRRDSTSQYPFDPCWSWSYNGRHPESPNTMLRGASDAGDHAGAFPFPPYMMAYSMAYPSGSEANSSQIAPPSPLMGSPVGTPTAMMFPQTPFAGVHPTHHPFSPLYPVHPGNHNISLSPTRSLSYPEPFSPMSPNKYGYFHPMFNSFPAFLIPPRQNSSSGTSPRKNPGANFNHSSNGMGNGTGKAGHQQQKQQPQPLQQQHQQQQHQQQKQQPQPQPLQQQQQQQQQHQHQQQKQQPQPQPLQQQQQQQQQQQKQGRSSMEPSDSSAAMFDLGALMGLRWPPLVPGSDPRGPGPWGSNFPQFPYPFPPNTPIAARAAASAGVPPYCMQSMQLLQPLYAMGASVNGSGPNGCPAPPHPQGPSSPQPIQPTVKGCASTGTMGPTTHANPRNFSQALHPSGVGSDTSSTCSTMPSTPAHSPPNDGGGVSVGGGSSSSGHKNRPRPPPLQLNMLGGNSGNGLGPQGVPAGCPGGPPIFFPPAGQRGIPMPPPYLWDTPCNGVDPHTFNRSTHPFPPPQHLHPQGPHVASAPPAPPPFIPLPGPFGLPHPAFMPMPFFPPCLTQANGMPLMAHMMPPGLAGMMPSFAPGVPAPPPPPVHPMDPRLTANSPYPAMHYGHSYSHPTPPNSSSKGKRPQQMGGSQGSAAGSRGAKGDTPRRLNARQRRTLRRAKERAIRGLMDAGHLALKQGEKPRELASSKKPSEKEGKLEDQSGSDAEEATKAAAAADNATATYYVSAAMSVVAGSHGPEAAANASEAISRVAADLDDIDLTNLISHLSQRKDKGACAVGQQTPAEEGLLRDLQIIQNLIGLLKAEPKEGGGSDVGEKEEQGEQGKQEPGGQQGVNEGMARGQPQQLQQQQQQGQQHQQEGAKRDGHQPMVQLKAVC